MSANLLSAPRTRRARRARVRPAALVAALALAGGSLVVTQVTAATEAAAVPTTIPLTLTNNSGRGEQVHVYVIGTELSSGRQGWADASGAFHPWPAGGNPPTPAPDASIAGPANGQSKTIRMPKFSGRVYFSYGQKLVFKLTTGGLVQPAVQNPSDPNANILFNWTEYTLNDAGLWINSTQVDMFSAPYAVGVKRPNGTTLATGHLKPGGYKAFFDSLRSQPGGWGGLIKTRSDGTILRALAPGHGIEAGALPASVMNDYVNRVWSKYSSQTLTVQPFKDQPSTKYFGRVQGNTMNFTNSSGAVVTSFQKPDSDSIFGCYKLLDAPNDLVRGPISRTLCAGYNRSTLLSNPNQPDANNANFYKDAVTNHYSAKVHAQMADGKAYGFAFDDVGAHESLVHDGDPQQAYITLDPFN
ncbi:glycoside hydrolase family 64 protein [Streptomyces sp. NPDC052071]|uniref:glycoside hydrolase family 64 protein n=1 Tax=Streptomyces TaxID=1883 RepID=UPI0033CF3A0B